MPSRDSSRQLVVASYNVHRCYGADGRSLPERVAEVLRALDADVIALQEVDTALPEHGLDQLGVLSRELGMSATAGPTLLLHRAAYGNALLARLPTRAARRHDLSVPGPEPRGALDVELDLDGTSLRVVATHLGLRRRERARQARWLLEILEGWEGPTVLLGDLNEWLPGTGVLRLFDRRFGRVRTGPSFPARRPVLGLDRIWVDPRAAVVDAAVVISARARAASDHLPVRARLDLDALIAAARGGRPRSPARHPTP